MTLDLLAIVAHPDDAELLCGGALAKAAAQGKRVGVLDLTAGELGSAGTRQQRAQEAQEAARILGLCSRDCAELPDGALTDSLEARRVVARWIRGLGPRIIISHWPEARHPDHAAASQLTQASAFLAGLKQFPVDGEPHRPHKLLYALTYQETHTRPTFVVDISEQMETKLASIFAFDTQFSGKTAMGDVLGGGDRPLREQILAHHAHYGSMIRRRYGEPYWTRETMRVEDLTALDVSSF
ncbi:MAG TPA: bacillithiol biosynthesis deacetylase BshB1 [Longimicrobiales bacterium]|nr:bacillithiol biosynthesis deacetylase BshB1 [Longimicrobiales bacterium]